MTSLMSNQNPLDTQCVEILGQNLLTEQLIRGGLEVAKPTRDRGVDLIAYIEQNGEVNRFVARPIQIKAASQRGFSIDQKYERIIDLLITYIWHVDSEEETRIYAMSYAEAVDIADQLGWTQTESWAKGCYSTTSPSKRVEELMNPFLMTAEKWHGRLTPRPVTV